MMNEINKNDLLGKSKQLRKEIDILRNDIKKMNIFEKLVKDLEIYYNVNKDIINSYDVKKRNFIALKNIFAIKKNTEDVITDLININNEKEIIKKYSSIFNVYKNLVYEYKTERYKNGDIYIGEFKNQEREGFGIMYYSKDDKKGREKKI